jgi:hypothetical protein
MLIDPTLLPGGLEGASALLLKPKPRPKVPQLESATAPTSSIQLAIPNFVIPIPELPQPHPDHLRQSSSLPAPSGFKATSAEISVPTANPVDTLTGPPAQAPFGDPQMPPPPLTTPTEPIIEQAEPTKVTGQGRGRGRGRGRGGTRGRGNVDGSGDSLEGAGGSQVAELSMDPQMDQAGGPGTMEGPPKCCPGRPRKNAPK